MSRIQLALDVDDLEASVAFYTALLGAPPAKRRPGYANFAVTSPPLKLVLLENPGRGGRLNHLGVEVEDAAAVRGETARLRADGLIADEEHGSTCCWATQDKVWVTGPDRERWEVYTVLADAPVFGDGASAPSAAAGTTTAAVAAAVDPVVAAPTGPDATASASGSGTPSATATPTLQPACC